MGKAIATPVPTSPNPWLVSATAGWYVKVASANPVRAKKPLFFAILHLEASPLKADYG
jgi:hypothetical protein